MRLAALLREEPELAHDLAQRERDKQARAAMPKGRNFH
jgi:hypothetical protein